jgi:hypothetical protein
MLNKYEHEPIVIKYKYIHRNWDGILSKFDSDFMSVFSVAFEHRKFYPFSAQKMDKTFTNETDMKKSAMITIKPLTSLQRLYAYIYSYWYIQIHIYTNETDMKKSAMITIRPLTSLQRLYIYIYMCISIHIDIYI